MVLRKMLDKFRSKSDTIKKQDEGQGGGDTKKKLKKLRSVKVADLDGIRKTPKKTGNLPLNKSPQQVTDEVPNYMKSTTSHDARQEKNKVASSLVRNSSLKLLRHSMKKNKGKNLQSNRVNCSSTSKDSETLKAVDHNENHDPLAHNICQYTYCTLHGQKHGFLSARRKLLKIQKSIKLKSLSIRKKGDEEIELVEDVVNELFIEIHSKLQEWGEETSGDDAEIKNIVNRMNKMKLEYPNDLESCSVSSIDDCGDKNSEISMEDIQVINQFLEFIEKGCKEESKFGTENSEEVESEAKLSNFLRSNEVNGFVNEVVNSSEDQHLQARVDISKADLNNFAVENNVKDCSSLVSRPKTKYSKLRRQTTNRLLALKAEHEQEKVNLKHLTVEERKEAEEWKIDYALRKALRRLGSSRKSKVPLLVAAFETVMPQMCETMKCCDAAGNIGPK